MSFVSEMFWSALPCMVVCVASLLRTWCSGAGRVVCKCYKLSIVVLLHLQLLQSSWILPFPHSSPGSPASGGSTLLRILRLSLKEVIDTDDVRRSIIMWTVGASAVPFRGADDLLLIRINLFLCDIHLNSSCCLVDVKAIQAATTASLLTTTRI